MRGTGHCRLGRPHEGPACGARCQARQGVRADPRALCPDAQGPDCAVSALRRRCDPQPLTRCAGSTRFSCSCTPRPPWQTLCRSSRCSTRPTSCRTLPSSVSGPRLRHPVRALMPTSTVWHQKGHKPQGKIEFLAAAAPLVKVSARVVMSARPLSHPAAVPGGAVRRRGVSGPLRASFRTLPPRTSGFACSPIDRFRTRRRMRDSCDC